MICTFLVAIPPISPYISEGSGLKRFWVGWEPDSAGTISPYISEGSGLKQREAVVGATVREISPYISEGSGLKLPSCLRFLGSAESPLTSVRGAD